jgi:ABC-2 type transport system ATP-binding protein
MNLAASLEIIPKLMQSYVIGFLLNSIYNSIYFWLSVALLKPTSGTAVVNGYDIVQEASKVRASIGIVFQAPSSDDMLTGYENLKLHSLLYALPKRTREMRITEVLNLVGLTERKDDQVKKYSGGMRRRLEIARGLLHKPKSDFP